MPDNRTHEKNGGSRKNDRLHKPFRIGLVCHGNIARSQILHHYLQRALEERGIETRIFSCGTAPEEAYPNARELLTEVEQGLRDRGMEVTAERTPWTAKTAKSLERCDLVLTADNYRKIDVLQRTAAVPGKVRLFYEFIGEGKKDFTDTFDPVEGRQDHSRFERCFDELERIAGRTAARIADLIAADATEGSDRRSADHIPKQEQKTTDEEMEA